MSIHVVLPFHLRNLAQVDGDIEFESSAFCGETATLGSLLDAIETKYPVLRGAIRDQTTRRRRPFVRFYACKEDLSHEPAETALPVEVISGAEPFYIVGAMAGG